MRKNVSSLDIAMVRDVVSKQHVLDFFKLQLHSEDIRFEVRRSIFDKIEIDCCYYNRELDYQDKYSFVVDLNDRVSCNVSVILEGLYNGNDLYTLLQLQRILENQIDVAMHKSADCKNT